MGRTWDDVGIHIVVLAVGSFSQSYYLGTSEFIGRRRYLLGNLIGVAICLVYWLSISGFLAPFRDLQVQLYLTYSLCVGLIQEARSRIPANPVKHFLILMEHLTRVALILAPFWANHVMADHDIVTLESLFDEPMYLYLLAVFGMYGFLVGMGSINEYRYRSILRSTAEELLRYSEWFLGRDLMRRSFVSPGVLDLQSAQRSVLFMDIRDFTQWSSAKPASEVVGMVNRFFRAAESQLLETRVIKVELTGDEIMAVFDTPFEALRCAVNMREAVRRVLPDDLDVGIGINSGPLVEGLVGGTVVKKYSVMGDTVNVGKRICDIARRGEVLMSDNTREALGDSVRITEVRSTEIKGKVGVFQLHILRDLKPEMVTETPPSLQFNRPTYDLRGPSRRLVPDSGGDGS